MVNIEYTCFTSQRLLATSTCAKKHQLQPQSYGITLKFLTTSGRLLDDVCSQVGTLTRPRLVPR
ncbi:hypothetical protein E2C01_037564 [Portunus trituberculatus]|uniref:Uncharacterized protein n=1 Tax=Portunus trituberculatus TaxID=210409 RepID=A0A5B7FEX7_PORTR|nr:hypothetical protein [Portunus trituberculatus]